MCTRLHVNRSWANNIRWSCVLIRVPKFIWFHVSNIFEQIQCVHTYALIVREQIKSDEFAVSYMFPCICTCLSHGSHMNESWVTYEWVTHACLHMYMFLCIWRKKVMSHIHIHECHVPYSWMCALCRISIHVMDRTYVWIANVMSHLSRMSCHTWCTHS